MGQNATNAHEGEPLAKLQLERKPAVFLDRDGVLNIDHGYVHSPEEFEWVPGAREAIKRMNAHGYHVFVVTNQAGIAHGYYEEEAVQKLHAWMTRELKAVGARVDEYFYCPHHPDAVLEMFRVECSCRKPRAGMLHQALERWSVDLERSFLIGDKTSDLQAADEVSVPGYLFDGDHLDHFCAPLLKVATS